MNKLYIIFIAIICLTSCKEEQIATDVKLVANDDFAKDANLFIDGYFIESFSSVDENESVEPCIDLSNNFPIISLDPSRTSVGKSFYDFVIISDDYKYQQRGTKIFEDGICQKWALGTEHLKPVVNERFDIQGMVKVSSRNVLIKVYDTEGRKEDVLKVILNNNALVSNFVSSKGIWEESFEFDEGMNFIAIEAVSGGEISEIPITPTVEILVGDELHTFQIQSFYEQPGAFLIACHK